MNVVTNFDDNIRIHISNKNYFRCFGLECQDFEQTSYSQLPESLSPGYKYLHTRQIPLQLTSFPSLTIPDCIRYIIGVFCCNFKSQTNVLASY